jgi:uncharacterized membrane-anchored protein YitT (DUF2179 family)
MLGGSNGIALFIQQFVPIRLSIISAVINATLFFLGLGFLGWKFAATSLLSTIVYPIILAVFEFLPLGTLFAESIVICALFCGVLCGLGIGLVVRVGGSTGGMDIPPVILQKFKGIPVGKSLMFFDGIIILAQVLLKGTDGILYSLLIVVLTGVVIDHTIVSGEATVQIIIISPEYERIRHEILDNINCGVTMIDMQTGMTGEKRQAILSVVYAKKYPEIRDAALKIDKTAFIIASDVKNVNGQGYTLERVWLNRKH